MSSIEEHNRRFTNLVETFRRLVRSGANDEAAQMAQLAADYAWRHHTGAYSSVALEEGLAQVAANTIPPSGQAQATVSPSVNRVLHVLTVVYGLGGHSRFALRWIQSDMTRTHSVALTRQARVAVPAEMTEAVAARQGAVHRLDRTSATLLERAKALRQLAARFDLVILHVHPDDVTPLLAFARRAESPRVIFVNHADHVFWLGATLPDVFINYRLTGERLAVRRRGLSEGQVAVLPIPIDSRKQRVDRGEARRELGLDKRLVILTIGTAYKYEPLNGKGFLDYMAPILADHPEAALLAVGPDPTGRWRREENRSKGQIRALGRRFDLSKLFAASDIYMDSSPFGSVTATLEAGIHGLPVLEFHPLPAGSEILGSDSPGLMPMVVTHSAQDLAVRLSALLSDSQLRTRIGQEMKAAIEAAHTNGGWQATLEAIYQLRPQRTAPKPAATAVEPLDYLTAELQSAVVARVGLRGRIAFAGKQTPGFWFLRHLRGLPSAAERLLLLRLLPAIIRANVR